MAFILISVAVAAIGIGASLYEQRKNRLEAERTEERDLRITIQALELAKQVVMRRTLVEVAENLPRRDPVELIDEEILRHEARLLKFLQREKHWP